MWALVPVCVNAEAPKNRHRVGQNVVSRVHAVPVPLALDPATERQKVTFRVQITRTVISVHRARGTGIIGHNEVFAQMIRRRNDGRVAGAKPNICHIRLSIPLVKRACRKCTRGDQSLTIVLLKKYFEAGVTAIIIYDEILP